MMLKALSCFVGKISRRSESMLRVVDPRPRIQVLSLLHNMVLKFHKLLVLPASTAARRLWKERLFVNFLCMFLFSEDIFKHEIWIYWISRDFLGETRSGNYNCFFQKLKHKIRLREEDLWEKLLMKLLSFLSICSVFQNESEIELVSIVTEAQGICRCLIGEMDKGLSKVSYVTLLTIIGVYYTVIGICLLLFFN